MLQEEVTLIAGKLEISDFIASNGWLENVEQKYSISKKTVAEEAGGVNKAGRSVQGKLQLGGMRAMLKTWMRRVGFGVVSLKHPRREGKMLYLRKKSEKMTNMGIFCKCGREKEDPVVIGTFVKPRCFKNLQLHSRPYNYSCFANSKAWMNTEIMTTVLSK